MPNSGQEGEFKAPIGFVDTKTLYPPPPPASGDTKPGSVDMADYLEHQFDETASPS